jgi:hypothetical protein
VLGKNDLGRCCMVGEVTAIAMAVCMIEAVARQDCFNEDERREKCRM